MYTIVPVIGESFHVVEHDPINNENRKAKNKSACRATGKIEAVEDAD